MSRSPSLEIEEDTKENSCDSENSETISAEAVPKRKRESKAATKTTCAGCQGQFWKLTNLEIRLCHNCVKIHQAVVHLVTKNKASVNVVYDARDHAKFLVTCMRGHEWVADFRAKVGRRWCQTCPAIERQERRQAILQEAARQQARLAKQQQEMFEEARQRAFAPIHFESEPELAGLPEAEA